MTISEIEALEARNADLRAPMDANRMAEWADELWTLPKQSSADEDSASALRLWAKALGDLDGDLLEAAFRICARTCDWFPAPAQIRRSAKVRLLERHNSEVVVAERRWWLENPVCIETVAQETAARMDLQRALTPIRNRHRQEMEALG